MGFELLLVVALIILFISSFCGLLDKIRKSYDEECQRIENNDSINPDIYINPSFIVEIDHGTANAGVFPSAPPPYSESYCDPPPNYEDIIKEITDARENINNP